jgi:hypothetical protein
MHASRDKLESTRAHNITVSQAHGCTMCVCGLKNLCICGAWPRTKNLNGFLSIQLGISWLAGRLRPVSAPAS